MRVTHPIRGRAKKSSARWRGDYLATYNDTGGARVCDRLACDVSAASQATGWLPDHTTTERNAGICYWILSYADYSFCAGQHIAVYLLSVLVSWKT